MAARRFSITPKLWERVNHFSLYNQTGVSLRQMVEHGRRQSPMTILQAGQFLSEELPVRLAHRVKELDELPNGLNEMPSIIRVKEWYAQSFEELVDFPKPQLPDSITKQLANSISQNPMNLSSSTPNPSLSEEAESHEDGRHDAEARASKERMRKRALALAEESSNTNGNGNGLRKRIPIENRYYADHANIKQVPPEVTEYNEQFTRCLEQIKKRHDAVVTTVAQGVLEYKRANKGKNIQADVQRFLDRFYMSRIGIRILIGQHIALARTPPSDRGAAGRIGALSGAGPDGEEPENYVGIICTNTNVGAMAREAIENARFVCEEHYGLFKGPPVQLICPKNLMFMYIPSHLNHMIFELLKNSLRAVVERYGVENEDHYPPIKVIVVEGQEDITIKISDEGGGIPRSEMPLVWTYMYTTAQSEDLDPDFQSSDFKAPMAGFGYGLPLARLYSRYFGGDLKLISMEGYGTDAYLHLNRLSTSAEPLP